MDLTDWQNLSPEVREALRDLDFETAKMLAISARLDRERAQAKEWPADPMTAIREAQRAGGAHVSVKLDEPVKLAIATMVIAGVVLQYQHLDTLEGGALQSLLEVSESALRAWEKQQDEMSARLRAITNPRV